MRSFNDHSGCILSKKSHDKPKTYACLMKFFVALFICIVAMLNVHVHADYALGCKDPEYHRYIENRFAYFDAKNRRLLAETLRDYELSLATSKNPYRVIGDLSRHLKYSAQFDPIELVNAKIDRIFEHSDALSVKQKIAGDVFDRFSSETHSVGIARAWIAYRQGNQELAFEELLASIEVSNSAVLGSFGPDFELVREMYRDGYLDPVIAYINKTEEFWFGKRPDGLRYVWLKMIEAECKIQFDSVDSMKVLELGLNVLDVSKDYGLSR